MLEAQPVVFTSVGETLNIGYEGGREGGGGEVGRGGGEGRWGGEVGRGRGGGEGEGRGGGEVRVRVGRMESGEEVKWGGVNKRVHNRDTIHTQTQIHTHKHTHKCTPQTVCV